MSASAASSATLTWVSLADFAKRVGVHLRTAQHKAKSRAWTTRRIGKGYEVLVEALPQELQLRWFRAERAPVSNILSPTDSEISRRLERHPEPLRLKLREEAARLGALLERLASIPQYTAAGGLTPEVEAIRSEWPTRDPEVLLVYKSWGNTPSLKTLYRKLDEYHARGSLGLLRAAPARAPGQKRIVQVSPEVINTYRVLRSEKPKAPLALLYKHICAAHPGTSPSLPTLWRWVQRNEDVHADRFDRDGSRTWRASLSTPLYRDSSTLDVFERLCGDHRELDIFVMDPAKKGGLTRPWLTMWFDIASRAPVGWVLSFKPNSRTIAMAYGMAISPKPYPEFQHLYGIPAGVETDNGRDYRSQLICNVICKEFGGELHFADAYNARAKVVERFFKTLADQFDKDFPTYCGRNTSERSERFREMVAHHERYLAHKESTTPFVEMKELNDRLVEYIRSYLRTPHEGLLEPGIGRDVAPIHRAATRKRGYVVPDEDTIAMLAWPCEKRPVRKGCIKWKHLYFHCEALYEVEGKRVEVRIPPGPLSRVHVSTETGKRFFVPLKERLPYLTKNSTPVEREKVEQAIAVQKRRARDMRKGREAMKKERAGITPLAEAMTLPTPYVPAVAIPPAPPPPEAVRRIHPLDRDARQASSPPFEPEPPPFALSPEEEDRLFVVSILDERPPDLDIATPKERQWRREEQQEWDANAADIIQRRVEKRTTGGAK